MKIAPVMAPSLGQSPLPMAPAATRSFSDLLAVAEAARGAPAVALETGAALPPEPAAIEDARSSAPPTLPALRDPATDIEAEPAARETPQAPPLPHAPEHRSQDAEVKRTAQERAFGFSELGVFGADRANAHQPVVAERPAGARLEALAPPAREAPGLARLTHSPSLAGGDLPGSALPGEPQAAPGFVPTRATLHQGASPVVQDGASTPMRIVGAAARKAAPTRADPPEPPPRRPVNNPSELSLVFTDRNGSAQLVAAAGGLNAEGRAALRKAATEVLAEFGLDLGDLTLNGEAVEPFTITQTGAFDGDSTR